MTQPSAPRAAILDRIRDALRDVPRGETPEGVPIPREYVAADPTPRPELIARFVERVSEYKAVVRRVTTEGLTAAIAEACAGRGVRTLVVPRDLPAGWAPDGVTALPDHALSHDALDAADGVLTACALGIAQTGTIALDCGPGQGRRALSLVPDYHLCVVRESQVVGSVPEAVARLDAVARQPGRPITLISGPSATSDIELNRVEGVHGPRTLEVLVVAD